MQIKRSYLILIIAILAIAATAIFVYADLYTPIEDESSRGVYGCGPPPASCTGTCPSDGEWCCWNTIRGACEVMCVQGSWQTGGSSCNREGEVCRVQGTSGKGCAVPSSFVGMGADTPSEPFP